MEVEVRGSAFHAILADVGLFFIFLIGICVGSFLNVLIDRIPRGESVIKGRSYCESCEKPLGGLDLIPLFSFVLLKGRCRYCHSPISWYYPIVELTSGLLFLLVASFSFGTIYDLRFMIYDFKEVLSFFYYLFIVSSLVVIFFTDLKHGIIPDKIIYPSIFVSLIFLISQYPNILISNILSAFGAFSLFFFLFLITKGKGMGLGDVKLAFLLGLFLGFPKIIVSLYAAFLTGSLVSLILVILGKKKLRKDTVPFGPFLVIGAFTALFLGDKIMANLLLFLLRQ